MGYISFMLQNVFNKTFVQLLNLKFLPATTLAFFRTPRQYGV